MGSRIIVEGFKSIGRRAEVEVRPLTLLAGANSSGKSSLMQAILLLKQTLDAPFDPGALLLNGPNVKFTSYDQLLHMGRARADQFTIGLYYDDGNGFESHFRRASTSKKFEPESCQFSENGDAWSLHRDMDPSTLLGLKTSDLFLRSNVRYIPEIVRHRFTLEVLMKAESEGHAFPFAGVDLSPIDAIIHLPGLRGNPERTYPLAATGPGFPGTFERYTASLIASWAANDTEKLSTLGRNLEKLGLTWRVEANNVDDASVELRVGRLPRPTPGDKNDMVSIADVGFGVSQALPVLVALLEARPGQFVFIEQPEIHLHPRAQTALAEILADAAKRGVKLVVETHSSLLLLAIQTLVAEGDLDPDIVKLHWFTRDQESGSTQITSADLDDAGRFGDWPEDFDNVALEAQSKYLDAVEAAVAKE
ncbi:MAG: hypothetical protein JWP89_3470 [Schlesneria sp.]|nr:hypothetical protein [Schlesneria sp.]